MHSVTVTYDHAAEVPLALGFALDRAQTRTVRYPPLEPGAARRSTTLDLRMERGPAVIRVAEGTAGTPLRVHSIRITGSDAGPGPAPAGMALLTAHRDGAVRVPKAVRRPRTGPHPRPRPAPGTPRRPPAG
ncbi:hypothetical protein [Clavibacter sp. CT19]|uniref:hypothetical protein n=1 Tax=unclassified Clavibacter TaxID=2626594 RepID=UPI0022EA5DDF|nr:hypothetical protein [Clavibacter sp. CT19]MDA3804102.1 hypothetical protein [Clavibacter sp. CT19]